jgi:hypothetical protein
MTSPSFFGLARTTIDVSDETSAAYKLTSSHTWNATPDQPIHVTDTLYELNDITVPFQRRPQVRWMHGKNN